MVMHVNQIYYSDHFRIHTDMESLSCRLDLKLYILCQLYLTLLKKDSHYFSLLFSSYEKHKLFQVIRNYIKHI